MSIITMVYGTYNFSPVPILNLTKQYQTTADGTIIGAVFNARLDGTIYAGSGGLSAIIAAQQTLRQGFINHGQLFQISCDGSGLIKAYPRIVAPPDFQPTNDNWVITSKYTIDLQWDDELILNEDSALMPPYVAAAEESWTVEFADDKAKYSIGLPGPITDTNPYQVRLTHSLTATGKKHYASGVLVKEAWEQARDYIIPRLGYNSSYISSSGVFNLDASTFTAYNHMRQNVADIAAGTFAVTENWIVINPSGTAGAALEDFTVDVRKGTDSDITTVSIQGSIQGLETRSYGTNPGDFTISTTKYQAASGYWENIKDNIRLYPRAQVFGTGSTRTINVTPTTKVVGHNPANGIITYSYEYNDRPMNCIAGAITESIQITDNFATDVFAEIPIPGRAAGPILQGMGTITTAKREVSIEAIVAPPSGCGSLSNFFVNIPSGSAQSIINTVYGGLTALYSQVFKHIDTQTWDVKTGRYTRSVGWSYQSGC